MEKFATLNLMLNINLDLWFSENIVSAIFSNNNDKIIWNCFYGMLFCNILLSLYRLSLKRNYHY